VKFFLKKEEQTEGKKREKLTLFKKNYPLRTHAFITCTTSTHLVHWAHFNILSSFFSEIKCKMAKKIHGNVLLLNLKSTCKTSGTFKEKKRLLKKKKW